MSEFVRVVGALLAENWNTPSFQFRLEHLVQRKRDRELLSHFSGWSRAPVDGTLEEWCVALIGGDPKYKNKSQEVVESALKGVLIQVGCEYPDMDKYSLAELQVANRKFALILEASGKVSVAPAISVPIPVSTPAPVPQISIHNVLSTSFQQKLSELEEARVSLDEIANSSASLSAKQIDLKVARQERAKLEENIKKMFNEIKGNLSSADLSDVERAQNKMGDFKMLITQRDEASNMVEGLERGISTLKHTMEEQKNVPAKQKVLSQDIETLIRAAEILGVSLSPSPVMRQIRPPVVKKPQVTTKKGDGNSRRGTNQRVLQDLYPTPLSTPSSQKNGFKLSQQQRERINQINDGTWYGTKFGHSGVVITASQDPAFKTKADFLQAMIDRTFNQKTGNIQGKSTYGISRCISAVRNRIASFPIWDREWAQGGNIIPDALETFLTSREQAAQQQAS